MLGDKLGNLAGKVVLRRVLSSGAGVTRSETTQRGTGTLLGVEYEDISTYESEFRPDGTLFGTGQGIYMGKGGEVATWTGQGVGTLSKSGGVSFRGAIYLLLDIGKVAASERGRERLRIRGRCRRKLQRDAHGWK